MRIKNIIAAVLLILFVIWFVEQWAPEWKNEARVMLQQLFRALR